MLVQTLQHKILPENSLERSLKLYSYSWNWVHRTLKWWYPYHCFIYQFPGSNEKSQRHQVSRGFRKRDTTGLVAERGDHPCPRTEFGVHVHELSIVARVGTKLLDVLETGHRIFLYLICKVGQKNNPRRLARHTILLSSSFFLFHVFDMLVCCFHSLGDLKLPGKREFGRRYALARYEDIPFLDMKENFLKMKQRKQWEKQKRLVRAT